MTYSEYLHVTIPEVATQICNTPSLKLLNLDIEVHLVDYCSLYCYRASLWLSS
jgi:hypothetical protein